MRHTVVNFTARRAALATQARTDGLDILVVAHPPNVRYLTGFTGSNGTVLVHADSNISDVLVTDRRYEGRTGTDNDLHVVFGSVSEQLAKYAGVIGLEADHVSWSEVTRLAKTLDSPHVRVTPTHGMVEALRLIKDADELAELVTACAITTDTLADLFASVRLVGMSERAIADVVSTMFRTRGADGEAFPAIVASGPNGAIAHHSPTDRVVTAGDLLTVDCGARVNGYHADCTRTVAIGVKPATQLAEIYAVVYEAQRAATAALTNNAAADTVDRAARDVIVTAGFGPYFIHGTGHGVGLEIHEAPLIGPHAGARLQQSVTCTREPGIYLPGVGGVRIEDTVVVTNHGAPKILTEMTRDLLVV